MLQYFLVPLVLKNGTGEPGGSTNFYNLYLYKKFFTFQDMSYGATLAGSFSDHLVLTLVLFWTARRWVYYAGERGDRACRIPRARSPARRTAAEGSRPPREHGDGSARSFALIAIVALAAFLSPMLRSALLGQEPGPDRPGHAPLCPADPVTFELPGRGR